MNYVIQQPTAGEFQQYPSGPAYSRSLFAINIENHTKQLNEARRHAMRERRHEHRSGREYNAFRYLEAKRALKFLTDQTYVC